jgi:hypothetical protein
MGADLLGLIAVIILVFTSFGLLLSMDWRYLVLALAGQYLGVFLLVWISWPLEQAVVKLVAGWMAGAILGTTLINIEGSAARSGRQINRVFRFLAGTLILLFVFSITPSLIDWVPGATTAQIWGGLLLIGIGLLHLGLDQHPLRVVLALLTLLSGFEILYSVVEDSILVAGLLAGIDLSLAMVGAYLLLAPTLEEVE